MTQKKTPGKHFDPHKNYRDTMKAIGYVPRAKATQSDYDRIGFKSGLEVHQQLKTKQKLFCRCPAGVYHGDNDYHAEIIRHMRPTLSEMGEYDGTALMEFKTRKEITYRINNKTTCTYEIDDTPPFPINREALEIALEISLLCKLNIVGEVHITRKQYLDGSIPTGFQRTAILGVEGEIQLKNKKVGLIQLSIEEDACREISDIGHKRIYKTDRLGMPLIETVTHPQCLNPDELREAADYIRFLNRSTGKVRTGIGAARQDTNVSCEGGTRVEIKGVSHNKWLPELSHNECFRQWALLHIKKLLLERVPDPQKWEMRHAEVDPYSLSLEHANAIGFAEKGYKVVAIALPEFHGILSHFTQPGKCFTNELSDRLKVIACIERPNITSDEDLNDPLSENDATKLAALLKASPNDAIALIWGPDEDIPTALETIDERCRMAFDGVPRETRRPLPDGTTLFERVLPGADRMYPDTDSAPIPLDEKYIEKLREGLPVDIWTRYQQLAQMQIPEDSHAYILRRNLVPVIEEIVALGFPPRFVGALFGHRLKRIEGKYPMHNDFTYHKLVDLFRFLKDNKIHHSLAKLMLPVIYQHPNMDFNSVLTSINFKRRTADELLAPVDYLVEKFKEIKIAKKDRPENVVNWVMGQLHKQALGNIDPAELYSRIKERIG
ncbi:Glu-tRNA(Gln) amidotransferase subunit GatE [Tenuifilum thalassicum]|uniref:Glu-tRNA(Gln) amidotransferase subunit GatE n=1 Tax=Tenuifilum thalassicum TaxID=2590900 RepID=A0A7D3XFF4_9BACT|nr:Glu-tRNA(Gln) amidotransferase subunit GatE [Tenuifilum thalassicum]QKG80807.1 Glu-tRNA(Gln) amidotransferase subunit GatE [Tenuifilum thalassicum]